MANIKIIVDSGSDIPTEIAKEHNITVLPFISIFGEDSYRAGVELTNDEFYQKLKDTKIIPTTAQTPYTEIEEAFRTSLDEYDAVICFVLSSKGSGQYSSMNMIKRDIEESGHPNKNLYLVDTMSYSIGISLMAVYASNLAKQGLEVEEILQQTHDYFKLWDIYLVVDQLTYLEKGGRINKASALIGTLLDVKPVLSIRGGLIEAVDKIRGKKKIVNKLIEKIKDNPNFDAKSSEFGIVHSDVAIGEEMKKALIDEFPNTSIKMYSELGPIIGTHTGAGAIAVFFRIK